VSTAHLSVNILTRGDTELTLFSGCAKMNRLMRRTHTKACISIAILLACCASAFALDPSLDVSQYAHTAWKVRDGTVKGAILSIAQTPDGYLWLGTEFGLARFDGVRAVPWQPPAGEHLPSNFISTLLVEREGTLWIGTHRGLARWKEGKLTNYPEVGDGNITALIEDRDGTVWIGEDGSKAGNFCAAKGSKMQCYGAGRFGHGVGALYEDPKGNLWVAAEPGLWRWAPGIPERYSFPRGTVYVDSLIEDDNGTLLLGSPEAGLKQLVGGKIEDYAIAGVAGQFNAGYFLRSIDGSTWVGSWQGLFHLHHGRVDRFAAADGLSDDFVHALFEDREGNVWIGTGNGLDRFREAAVPTISRNQSLLHSAAWSVQATPDGSIWIATADGLSRRENGHVTVYRTRKAPAQRSRSDDRELGTNGQVSEISNSGLTGDVQSLGQDDRGRLWASTTDGVFYFERARFVRVPGVPGGTTYSIKGDGHGNVWISNYFQGLFSWTEGGPVERIPWLRFGQKRGLELLPDPRGGLWLGFYEGGVAYFQAGQVRASYNTVGGLGFDQVSLRLGSRGALWAATEVGLSRIKDGHVATLTSKNGLPCDAVYWSMEDDDNAVWLYMPCGLVRIARSELDAWASDNKHVVQTTVFDISDGVRTLGIPSGYLPHVTKSPDGKIWFTPRDGVSVIDPRHIPFNKLPPPVQIEQIVADGKTYWQNWSGDASSSPQKLPPLVRDLTIDYTALSLAVPEKVHFRFKLEGQDKDWREVVNQRRVEYSNLPPRHYRFRVIASNNSGVWNEQGASLDVTIDPAYWQTNWFRALCVLAFMALLWTYFQLRVRGFERRQAVLEKHQAELEGFQSEIRALNEQMIKAQEAERMRISGELHDGVLQQITSLTLRLGTVKYQVPPDSEAKATITGLQNELIKIGTDIRQVSHELHPALLHESGLPAALSSYCEEFSKVRGLPVSCEADPSVRELSPGAALCLYRIAQEALGNAAKHSKAKKVEVRLTRSDGRVFLSVSDDGVGCVPGEVGKSGGLGLINMRERVLQLNGTFEFDSEPGRGASVKVSVPFRAAK
jgi:signal transduction histidine kinase/ligand-binding sensor domain-containing protein